jgi:hypothetical protein
VSATRQYCPYHYNEGETKIGYSRRWRDGKDVSFRRGHGERSSWKTIEASHRFWVPCIGLKMPVTYLDILSKYLNVTQSANDPFNGLLFTLEASKEPRLILLDNFETAWSLPGYLIEGGRILVECIPSRQNISPSYSRYPSCNHSSLQHD